jgi:hypothetical protein
VKDNRMTRSINLPVPDGRRRPSVGLVVVVIVIYLSSLYSGVVLLDRGHDVATIIALLSALTAAAVEAGRRLMLVRPAVSSR